MDKPLLRTIGRFFLLTSLLFLVITAFVAAEENSLSSTEETMNHTRALVAVYLIGSDLETTDNDGTEGIKQFIQGYGVTSPQDLSVIIAYGGSKKSGWDGMTIETIKQLQDDLKDGAVGNDQIYEYHNNEANMGSSESLSTFLSWVQDHYSADTRYLIFSDHGGGWGGFGSDENHDGSGLLLSDITGPLKSSGFKPDLTGFDACLMGEIEVAHSLSPYSPLLVGSEETEPGDGWKNDRWIQLLAKDPGTKPVQVGKTIIDSYVEESKSEKTLSLIDTTKTNTLITSLNDFGQVMPGDDPAVSKQFASSYRNLKSFGGSVSVDLINLSRSFKGTFPDYSDQAEKIEQSAKELVLYERHTPDLSYASGISIMSPENLTPDDFAKAGEGVNLAPAWDNAFVSLLGFISGSAELIGLHKTEDGRYELTDPSGYAIVQSAYFRIDGGQTRIIGTIPIDSDDDGLYSVPDWDGRWFYVRNNSSGTYIIPSFSTVDTYDDGTIFMSAPVMVNQKEANLEILVNGEEVVSTEITPYTTDAEGDTMYGNSYLPEDGDVISINIGESPQESITWSESTSVNYEILPDGKYATGLYIDQVTGAEDSIVDQNISIKDGVISQVSS